jgi:hypothetical protein
LARQINLICVPQLMGVQGPLAAQIGYVRAIRVGHVLWVAGGRCHHGIGRLNGSAMSGMAAVNYLPG